MDPLAGASNEPQVGKIVMLDYTALPSESEFTGWAKRDEICFNSVIDQAKRHRLFGEYSAFLNTDVGLDDDYVFGSEDGDQLEDMNDWLRWIRAHPGKNPTPHELLY